MRNSGLIDFRRHDPHFAGKRASDLLAGDEPRRVDAIIIGDENTHSFLLRVLGAAQHEMMPADPGPFYILISITVPDQRRTASETQAHLPRSTIFIPPM